MKSGLAHPPITPSAPRVRQKAPRPAATTAGRGVVNCPHCGVALAEETTEVLREAEMVMSLASSVYRQLDEAQRAEDYVRQLSAKWGEHPAFKKYMSEMLLADRLAEFVGRPKMTRV